MEHNVSCYGHGICQVAIDLVQDILAWSTEQDGAGFRSLAFGQEGEVLIADLLDLEQPALRAYVRLLEIVDTVYYGCASCPGDSVVICLSNAAESCDVALEEIMLCEI